MYSSRQKYMCHILYNKNIVIFIMEFTFEIFPRRITQLKQLLNCETAFSK